VLHAVRAAFDRKKNRSRPLRPDSLGGSGGS
jgi:hypothetical protein